jgi:predicted component of type VI protein secretion system
MKKIFVLVSLVLLFAGCDSSKKVSADEHKDELSVQSGALKEYYLVYNQKEKKSEFLRVMYPLSVCVILENDTITGYSIQCDDTSSYSGGLIDSGSVEITPQEFEDFRKVLEKALEWDRTARENNVESFYFREIPSSISFRNIEWYTMFDGLFKSDDDAHFEFRFNWSPHNIDAAKSELLLSSSVVYGSSLSDMSGKEAISSFNFNTEMNIAAVQDFLESTTDEKVKESVTLERKFLYKASREAEEKEKIELLFN